LSESNTTQLSDEHTVLGSKFKWQSVRPALRIALIFFGLSGTYIYISGKLLASVSQSLPGFMAGEIVKGFIYVFIMSVVLFILVFRSIQREQRQKAQLRREQRMLQKSEERYRTIISSIDNLMFVHDENDRFIDVHYSNKQNLFVPQEDFLGKLPEEVLPEKLSHQFTKQAEEVRRTGNLQKLVYPLVLDKSHKWFEARLHLHENGKYIVSTVEEISEKKAIQERLTESEAQFRRMVEDAPEPIFIQIDHKFAYLNSPACRLFGVQSMEELIGQPVIDRFLPKYHQTVRQRIQLLNEKEESVTELMEYECFQMDGSKIWIETAGTPVAYNGGQGAVVFVRDITERKLRENQYQDLIDGMREAVLVTDLDSHILQTNKAAVEFSGYQKSELIGMKPTNLDQKLGSEEIESILSDISNGKERIFETNFKTRSGEKIPVEVSANLITYLGKDALLHVIRDIRSRLEIQEDLVKTQQYLNTAAENLNGILYILNKDLQIILSKGRTLALLGFKNDEVVGESIEELLKTSEDVQSLKKKHLRVLNGESFSFEVNYGGRFLSINLSPIMDNKGKVQGVNGLVLDITEQREAEINYRQFFEDAPFPYQELDPAGNILTVNKLWLEEMEYSFQEIHGRWFGDFITNEDSRQRFQKCFEEFKRVGEIKDVEFQLQPKKSPPIIASFRGSAHYVDGRFDHSHCAFRDVTEERVLLKEQQQLYHAMEQSGEAVVITDAAGTIEYVNTAFEEITGYTKAEIIGENPRILQSGEHDEEFYRKLWDTISNGETWEGRFINLRKSGEQYHEESIISPVKDSQRNIINYVAVKRDISDKLHLESQLRQSQKMEAVGRLAGGVAHDFNNLLTVIKGYAGILSAELEVKEYREMAELIEQAGLQASDLSSQLLAVSRKQDLAPRFLEPSELIHNMYPMLKRVLGEDITFTMNLLDSYTKIRIDPGQVDQILMNLVVNARDAMPQGGVIDITEKEVAVADIPDSIDFQITIGQSTYYALSVKDTGGGMDDEVLEHIFEPFYTTKAPGSGTGLGLSTVFGIVKQSGGMIHVESTVGEGTTITLYFPVVDAVMTEEDTQAVMPVSVESLQGLKILVVDDEPGIGKYAKMILEKHGANVDVFETGTTAIKALAEASTPYDVLLVDIVLPEISGIDVASKCGDYQSEIDVIFMTGYTDDRIKNYTSGELPITLQKPFTQEELVSAVLKKLNQ